MKKIKSLICIALIFVILTMILSISCFAATPAMSNISLKTYQLSYNQSITYKTGTAKYNSSSEKIYINEFKPGETLTPVVTCGSKVKGLSTTTAKAKAYQTANPGVKVVGGINAAFFSFGTGVSFGLQVTNGVLYKTNVPDQEKALVSGSNYSKMMSVGFKSDGSAVYGVPDLKVKINEATDVNIMGVNLYPTQGNGIVVLTSNYASKTSWNSAYSYDVIKLKIKSGGMKIGSAVRCTVSDIIENTTTEQTIKEDEIYLVSVANYYYMNVLKSRIDKGQTLTIGVRDTTGKWKDVKNAFTGGDLLVENGKMTGLYDSSIKTSYTARSVIGIKSDGSVITMAVEKSNSSAGLPLDALAGTMINLGCQTVINLDGGGSTSLLAKTSPTDTLKLRNYPSDGSERLVGNAIILVDTSTQAKVLDTVEDIQNYKAVSALSSASISKPVDKAMIYSGYGAIRVNYEFKYSIVSGYAGFEYKTPLTFDSSVKKLNIKIYSGAKRKHNLEAVFLDSSQKELTVAMRDLNYTGFKSLNVEIPSKATKFSGIRVYQNTDENQKAGVISVDHIMGYSGTFSNDSISPTIKVSNPKYYMAGATFSATATDNDFGTGVDFDLSGIYLNQTFVKTTVSSNKISATLNSTSTYKVNRVIYEISDKAGNRIRQYSFLPSVNYAGGKNFYDVKASHWASKYVDFCFERKVVDGYYLNSKRYFKGDNYITREEFAAMVAKLKGLNVSSFKNVKLPYKDKSKISSWALNYVKAVYNKGYMTGDGENFNPKAYITRQEAATAIKDLVCQFPSFKENIVLKDLSSVSSWAKTNVNKVINCGVMTGNSGYFYPNKNITRYEIATIFARIY